MGADYFLSSVVELRKEIEERKANPKYAKLMDFIYKKYANEINKVQNCDYDILGLDCGMIAGMIAAPLIGYFCGFHKVVDATSAWGNIMLAIPGSLIGAIVGMGFGLAAAGGMATNLDKRIEKEVLQNEELLKKITEE